MSRSLATTTKTGKKGLSAKKKKDASPLVAFSGDVDLSRMGDLIDDEVIHSYLGRADSSAGELQTIGDVFRFAITEFSRPSLSFGQATVDPTDDALLLLLLHLKLPLSSTSTFLKNWGRARLTQAEVHALRALIARRVTDKVPVAYLCKAAFQQGEKLFVDERVLIPRSHIGELLAPKSRFFLYRTPTTKSTAAPWGLPLQLPGIQSVLDLCTGSGALAILAYRMLASLGDGRSRVIHATDISADALAVAEINLRDKRMDKDVVLARGDLFAALSGAASLPPAGFDLIISNPPYVDDAAVAALPAEYRREPALALKGGRAGLDLVTRIIAGSAEHLSAAGVLVVECGAAGKLLARAVAEAGGRYAVTSNSKDEVVVLTKAQCAVVAAKLGRTQDGAE